MFRALRCLAECGCSAWPPVGVLASFLSSLFSDCEGILPSKRDLQINGFWVRFLSDRGLGSATRA